MDLPEMILQDDDIEESVFSTFFDSDSSSSSSENNFLLGKQILEMTKVIQHARPKDYLDDLKNYSDEDFTRNFRLNRKTVLHLIEGYKKSDIYRSLINRANSRVSRINEEKTILIFLWFAGHQSLVYRDIARQFNINTGALFRIISDVSQYLNSISDEVIKWPNAEQHEFSTSHYLKNIGFPNVIGCIGSISISITKPLDNYLHCWDSDEHYGFVLQAVCNEYNKFIDIFAASPGVTETAVVFKNSPLCKKLTDSQKQDFLLITSNYNYPLTNYLITPYVTDDEPLTSKQFYFNEKLIKCCSDLDHTFDLLKRRFRQLYHVKLRDPTRIINFIKACCILHNIADEEDHICFQDEEWLEEDKSTVEEVEELLISPAGSSVRDKICDDIYKLSKIENSP